MSSAAEGADEAPAPRPVGEGDKKPEGKGKFGGFGKGDFGKGDAVQVATADGQPVARGLVRYDAADAARIVGVASAGLKAALGYEAGPVVIHADDLTLR